MDFPVYVSGVEGYPLLVTLSPKSALRIVVATFASTQALMAWAVGARMGIDTGRYARAGLQILDGVWPTGKAQGYLIYDLFAAAMLGIAGSHQTLALWLAVACQVSAALLATLLLYRAALRWRLDLTIALAAALAFVLNAELQQWNFYALTESLFSSLSVILLALLWGNGARPPSSIFVVALLATFMRPNGFVLAIPAVGALLLTHLQARRLQFMPLAVGTVVCAAAAGFQIYAATAFEDTTRFYRAGATISGGYESQIAVPELNLPDGLSPLTQAIHVGTKAPAYLLRLATHRLFWLLVQARPYYSPEHNIGIGVILVLLYGLGCVGWIWGGLPLGVRAYVAGVIALQSLAVMSVVADWDGRTWLPIAAVLCAPAGAGVRVLVNKVSMLRFRI